MRKRAPLHSHRVKNAHGLALEVHAWSEAGDVVLMLHGFGLSARVWDFVVPGLADHHRILGPDMRGHGESQHDPSYRYHHINLGRDIACLLDALAVESATLVAHSTSGHAAIGYAARFPARVAGLVLLDSGAELPSSRQGDETRDVALDFASPLEFEKILRQQHPRAEPAVLEHLAELWLVERADGRWVRKLDPAFYRPRSARDPEHRRAFDREAWAKKEVARLWHDLAEIVCPTLVVRGEHSRRFSRATQLEMTTNVMQNAWACEIQGAGHNLMLDQPAALGEVIATFLSSNSRRAG